MAMMNTRHQWQSTQERVDELTGKISVKKRDNESIFKKQREAIDKNEGESCLNLTLTNLNNRNNRESACDREGSATKISQNDEQRQPSNWGSTTRWDNNLLS